MQLLWQSTTERAPRTARNMERNISGAGISSRYVGIYYENTQWELHPPTPQVTFFLNYEMWSKYSFKVNVIALLYENRMSNGEWDYCSGDYRHTRYGEVSLKRSESRKQCHCSSLYIIICGCPSNLRPFYIYSHTCPGLGPCGIFLPDLYDWEAGSQLRLERKQSLVQACVDACSRRGETYYWCNKVVGGWDYCSPRWIF